MMSFMNGKTAKLISRYAKFKGENYKRLKSAWQVLNSLQRFKLRAEMLQDLGKEKK